jgi:hypothetical protein
MNLSEKEESLRATVAFPTVSDWQLSGDDENVKQALVSQLNREMERTLQELKDGILVTWGEVATALYSRIDRIAAHHPLAGIKDSEGSETMARFFAVNYEPAIYDFIRYRRAGRR